MILLPALLLAAAAPASTRIAPVPATAFLAALAAHDLAAARATLADEVQLVDDRRPDPGGATLDSFVAYVEGCRREDLTWDTDEIDPTRAAVTVTWKCPARADAQAFIWTAGARVVAVEFGMSSP